MVSPPLGPLAICLLHVAVAAALLPLPRMFRNNGTVKATDAYFYQRIGCSYLETPAVTQAPWAWAVSGGDCVYLFQRNQTVTAQPAWDFLAPTASQDCTPGPIVPHYDRLGGDLAAVPLVAPHNTAADCENLCCATDGCVAFVYNVAPGDFMGCKQGDHCCYLKGTNVTPTPSNYTDIATGVVTKPLPLAPPSGLRSAVPQGGLTSGSIELRGDGALYEWTIVNQVWGGEGVG
jgi:hypothetical protein